MGKKRLVLALLLLAAIVSVTACDVSFTRGSGDLITETREVSGFDSIDLSGFGEVNVTQGGGESLTIETDDNVMEHVKAEVSGGTLNLGFEDGVNAVLPTRLVFTVGVDELTSVSISGSGDIESEMIVTDRFDATISGSGDVQIPELTADAVEARISGAGEIDLGGTVPVIEPTHSILTAGPGQGGVIGMGRIMGEPRGRPYGDAGGADAGE